MRRDLAQNAQMKFTIWRSPLWMFAQARDEVNSSLNVTKKSDIAMKFTMQVMQ